MKKSKILSLVLALAMSLSLVPTAAVNADETVIFSENFDGKTTADLKAQGINIEGGENLIVIENDKVVAKTSVGGVGFNFSSLSAEAKGLVRVSYDVNLYNNSFDVNKSKLFTDGADIPLMAFGAYGSISQDYDHTTWTATLNKVEGVGYGTHWYNVDLLLDFDNNTITVNMKNLDTDTMAISDLVWNYDLSGINTIKGFYTYGWTHGNVADTGYDNLLIEYVTEETPDTPDEPDVPVTEGTIYEENFDGKTTADLKAQGINIEGGENLIVIENDKVVAKTSVGGVGFNFNFLSAEAKGLVRVKYDVNLYNNAFDVNKSKLLTDGADIPLIAFGAYGSISQDYDHTTWTSTLNKVSGVGYGTHWYNVDLLLDFDNNTITVNMKNLDTDTMAISDLVWNYDLSGINTIKGFYTYGWTHGNVADTGYDNLLIEYVTEETPDTPDEPDVPVTEGTIYEENFDGKTTADLEAQGYNIEGGGHLIVIENDKVVAKTSVTGTGFNFNFLSAEAKGLVRVSYDVNLYNNSFDVNKSKLFTDGADIPLMAFGAYGSISQDYDHTTWTATLNKVEGVGYGTHWYNVDLLLDFDNNTITVNMKNLDNGTMAISDLVWNYDLSGINTIKGFHTYGWTHGNVADTGYDNLLIEYVAKEIEIAEVDMTGYEGGKAWDVTLNEFDSAKTYTAVFADGEETKEGTLIGVENAETEGSVAFAIFLHTSRTNVVLDIVAE